MKNLKDLSERQKAYQEVTFLIERAIRNLSKEDNQTSHNTLKLGNNYFYSVQANKFLLKNSLNVMLPLLKNSWPSEFSEIITGKDGSWPITTGHCYVESVFSAPFISSFSLYFGYAVVLGKLRKTSFYVPKKLSDKSSQLDVVIDPIAWINGVKPEYYLGLPVDKRDLETYLSSYDDPLESYVNRQAFIKKNTISRSCHHASCSDGLEYL